MEFIVNGVSYKDFELTNKMVADLLNDNGLDDEHKEKLKEKAIERFICNLCPKVGETEDDMFARFFSNYVNRVPNDYKRAAKKMSADHRYLQNEMFKVCLAYIKELAHAYEEGIYDARNEYACEMSNKIINCLG